MPRGPADAGDGHRADGRGDAGIGQGGGGSGEIVGIGQGLVVVDEDAEFAAGQGEAVVPVLDGIAGARAGEVANLGISGGDLAHRIAGRVVGDDDLQSHIPLGDDRGEAGAEEGWVLERRDDAGDRRRAYRPAALRPLRHGARKRAAPPPP